MTRNELLSLQLNQRDYGISNVPEKVFINSIKDPSGIKNFEYSEIPPPHVNWSIEGLLEGKTGKQNFISLFYLLPEIFAPVNEIASRVSSAVWQLKKESNDEVVYNNKQFNKLFSKPNALMNFTQFVWQAVCYEILTGATIQYFNIPSTLEKSYENVLGWFNLPTQKVHIDKKKNVDPYSSTELKHFVNKYSIGKREFDIDNILAILNFDLANGNDVDSFKSQLTGAKIAIKNLIPVYEARGVIYVKRGALGFLVSKKSDESGLISLTQKEKEEAQKIYQNSYGLNAHKSQVGVAAAPLEYISTSMSIQELQPFDETLADAIAIYKVLRVPRHLVPSKDNSTFNNANSDMRSFYSDVIIPYAKKYAEAWTSFLNIEGHYIDCDFSHVDVLQENRKEKAEVDRVNGNTWLQRWQTGACTLNDWIVSFDGFKGTGAIYEKKIFELSEDEVLLVKNIINLKTNVNTSTENKGDETPSSTN